MKKTFLFLFALFCVSTVNLYAQNITLNLGTSVPLTGTLLNATDSTVTILTEGGIQPITIPAWRITSAKLSHGGKLYVEDGKIVIMTGADVKAQKRLQMVSNPNYAIGHALKTSGATALAIGVPCLAAGLATCIAGRVGYVDMYNVYDKANCIEASYYLFGVGAALTIVGVPLYIGGKKIMDMNVNFTGNGAGITMNF